MLAGIRQKLCWLIVSCLVVAMLGFYARTTWDGIKEELGHERLDPSQMPQQAILPPFPTPQKPEMVIDVLGMRVLAERHHSGAFWTFLRVAAMTVLGRGHKVSVKQQMITDINFIDFQP